MAHQRPLAPAPAAAAAATTTASPGSASSSSSLDPHLTAAAGLLASASASSSSSQPTASASRPAAAPTTSKPAKKPRRSKVAEACRFCRRSHMSCDAGRPCSRCVKRDIAHLCRDEPISSLSAPPPHPPSPAPASASASPKPRPPPPAAAQSTDKTPQPNSSVSQSATGALGANLLGLETVNGGAISSRPSLTPSLSATAANLSMAGSLGAGGGGQPTMSFATTQDGAGGYGQQQLPMLSTNFNLAMVSPLEAPSARRKRWSAREAPLWPDSLRLAPSFAVNRILARTLTPTLSPSHHVFPLPPSTLPSHPFLRLFPSLHLLQSTSSSHCDTILEPTARPRKRTRWPRRGLGTGHDDGAFGRVPRLGSFVRCSLSVFSSSLSKPDLLPHLLHHHSEFLQSLTDSPYLTSIDPTSHTSFSNLPTNSEAGLSGGQIDGGGAVGAGAGAGTGTGTAANGGASTGHSVPGSPVNKWALLISSPSLPPLTIPSFPAPPFTFPSPRSLRFAPLRSPQNRAFPPHRRRPKRRLPLRSTRPGHPR